RPPRRTVRTVPSRVLPESGPARHRLEAWFHDMAGPFVRLTISATRQSSNVAVLAAIGRAREARMTRSWSLIDLAASALVLAAGLTLWPVKPAIASPLAGGDQL